MFILQYRSKDTYLELYHPILPFLNCQSHNSNNTLILSSITPTKASRIDASRVSCQWIDSMNWLRHFIVYPILCFLSWAHFTLQLMDSYVISSNIPICSVGNDFQPKWWQKIHCIVYNMPYAFKARWTGCKLLSFLQVESAPDIRT